jgi:hypothetical protein
MGIYGKRRRNNMMTDNVNVIKRCPICAVENKEPVTIEFGHKDGQILHEVCLDCRHQLSISIAGITDPISLLTAMSEKGNIYAINLFRNIIKKRAGRSRYVCLFGGLRFPEIREVVLSMRKDGSPGGEIAQAIRDKWPDEPEKWVSRSSLYRFLERARRGKLKEFGIEPTLN